MCETFGMAYIRFTLYMFWIFQKKNRNFLVGFVIIKINLHPVHVSDMSCLKD